MLAIPRRLGCVAALLVESMVPVNGIQAWHMGEKQTGRKDRLGEKAGHPRHKAS